MYTFNACGTLVLGVKMVVISTVMRLVSCTFIAFRAEGLFAGGIKNQVHLHCPSLMIMW